ncbi:MAG TPA: peptidylprolyl isomerase [Casimicrobiaceae bacterium]|nr:peptidylprolyl isomerase [Casimicrobiaceae bacterium]
MNRPNHLLAAAAALLVVLSGTLLAEGSPDDVLVETATVKLTRSDYEADLLRVPQDMRAAFASDPKRLTAMLNNLLVNKTLAAQARQAGIDRDPEVTKQIAMETDRLLAAEQLRRFDQQAGAEFDAKKDDFLQKARETYAVDKDKYRVLERVRIAHIQFDTKKRSPEAALALAQATRAKLLAGADFTATAKEVSEDPAAKANGGELGWMSEEKGEPEFSSAALALKEVGQISEPVRSSRGYHLIKLEERLPARALTFDEAKGRIMGQLRARYVKDRHDAMIATIRSDPSMKVDQEAVDALVYRVDPAVFQQELQKKMN